MSTTEQGQRAEKIAAVEAANAAVQQAYAALGWEHPVGAVRWVPIEQVRANDYNPNSVPTEEMTLLHTSIAEDGYTQPVVTIWDQDTESYVVVDGYHRYTVMRRFQDIYASTDGFLPIVVIDKPIADRIASTVRHNRARGKHSVQGMGNLVMQMLQAGEDDEKICRKIGVDAEELARLKHVTGYSALYRDAEYSPAVMAESQLRAKAEYKKEHPDEQIPKW